MSRMKFLKSHGLEFPKLFGSHTADELELNGFTKTRLIRGFSEIRDLFELAKSHGSYICGGYARYAASKNKNGIFPSRDIDIFCPSQEEHDALIVKLDESFHIGSDYWHEFSKSVSMFATTYNQNPVKNTFHNYGNFPIQVIAPKNDEDLKTGGDVLDILNNFDLDVCQAAIVSPDEVLVSNGFCQNEKNGKMKLAKVRNPMMTFERICKYSSKNYKLPAEEIQKILTYYNGCDSNILSDIIKKDTNQYVLRKGNS